MIGLNILTRGESRLSRTYMITFGETGKGVELDETTSEFTQGIYLSGLPDSDSSKHQVAVTLIEWKGTLPESKKLPDSYIELETGE